MAKVRTTSFPHIEEDGIVKKYCSFCKIYVDKNIFSKNINAWDGLHRACKPCQKEYNKQYRQKHGKEIDKKDWQKKKNNPKYIEYQRQYVKKWCKEKRKKDVQYKITQNCRRRVRELLTKTDNPKDSTTQKYVGCNFLQLQCHLEKQFEEGMRWENYGTSWHIDHIVPVSAFDLQKEIQKRAAFHYTNLQPLWCKDNLTKSNKFNQSDFKMHLKNYIYLTY